MLHDSSNIIIYTQKGLDHFYKNMALSYAHTYTSSKKVFLVNKGGGGVKAGPLRKRSSKKNQKFFCGH